MFSNRDRLATDGDRETALDCIEAAIEGAAPETATRDAVALAEGTLTVGESTYDLDEYDDVVVVGAGKATGGVARALESILGDRLTDGVVVTKRPVETERVRCAVGDHPVPSERSVEATADLVETVRAADEGTLVLFVLTGGASALLAAPAGSLTISDLAETTRSLLEGGVPIDEINAVRKHLSAVKGGRLAREAAPATVCGLVLSDVVGNDLSTIGSGPTVPDGTTFADARGVLDRADVSVPDAVREHLRAETGGETPGPSDPAFDRVAHHLIADNATALTAAADAAETAGYQPLVLTSRLRGEASEVGKALVSTGAEAAATGAPVEPPAVLLAGGECTVSIDGEGGTGGPNQELVLSAALEREPVVLAAVDTDGEDGSSDVAGALVDGTTVADGERERAQEFLDANDAGTYLAEVGATIETGPTGTNVNDVVAMVVGERSP
ncbi:MAG: glycerate kinase [Halosimplex sp.]